MTRPPRAKCRFQTQTELTSTRTARGKSRFAAVWTAIVSNGFRIVSEKFPKRRSEERVKSGGRREIGDTHVNYKGIEALKPYSQLFVLRDV